MKHLLSFSLLLLSSLLISTAYSPTTAQSDTSLHTLEHGGETRTYTLYVPSTLAADETAPLLIALHPWGSSGQGFRGMTDLDAVADALGMIVAYPDALSFSWDDGKSVYEDRLADAAPRDDEGFLLALIDAVNELHPIDTQNVTLAGLGSGGGMAITMACNHPDQIRRVVVTGSLLSTYQRENCAPATDDGVDILYMVGEWDRFAGPDGRNISPPTNSLEAISVLSLNDTLTYWQERAACPTITEHERNNGLAVSVFDCNGTIAVITLEEAGHHWLRDGDYALNQYGIDMTAILQDFITLAADQFASNIEALPYTTDVWGLWTRSYRAYVPPDYNPSQAYPVVVALHGRPGNGYGMAYLADMNDTARAEGFIAVYPDGKNEGWNYTAGFPEFGSLTDQDDVEFFRLMIDDLALDYSIDRDQVYLMGFSNGGYMTVRMACESPETFAGYGVIGGGLMELLLGDFCTEPVDIGIIHGTGDPSINFDGIEQDEIWISLPTLSHVSFWGDMNGCSPENAVQSTINETDEDSSYVALFAFPDCTTGHRLRFWMVVGGGHTIPGNIAARLDESQVGAHNQDIDAIEVLWDFWTEE